MICDERCLAYRRGHRFEEWIYVEWCTKHDVIHRFQRRWTDYDTGKGHWKLYDLTDPQVMAEARDWVEEFKRRPPDLGGFPDG